MTILRRPLTEKQKLFVVEYLVDLNATQAAIRAGYSENSAAVQGCENLIKPNIQEAVQEAMFERSARTQITQDRVLKEYGRIAFVDPRKFFNGKGELVPVVDLDEDTARALAGMDYHAEWETSKDSKDTSKEIMGSTTKIKLIDKKGALDSLARHLGMFSDNGDGEDGTLILEEIRRVIVKPGHSNGGSPGIPLKAE